MYLVSLKNKMNAISMRILTSALFRKLKGVLKSTCGIHSKPPKAVESFRFLSIKRSLHSALHFHPTC